MLCLLQLLVHLFTLLLQLLHAQLQLRVVVIGDLQAPRQRLNLQLIVANLAVQLTDGGVQHLFSFMQSLTAGGIMLLLHDVIIACLQLRQLFSSFCQLLTQLRSHIIRKLSSDLMFFHQSLHSGVGVGELSL